MFFRRSFPLGVGTLHDMLAQWYRCVWDDWACSTAAVRTHAATAGGRAAAGTHAALPTCHRHIGIVPNGTTGLFEPLPYSFHKKSTTRMGGVFLWSGRRGSNSLPRPWQGRALPDELRPQNGASGRSRTNDTRIFSPLLYQLSYRGIWRPRWGSNPRPPA